MTDDDAVLAVLDNAGTLGTPDDSGDAGMVSLVANVAPLLGPGSGIGPFGGGIRGGSVGGGDRLVPGR